MTRHDATRADGARQHRWRHGGTTHSVSSRGTTGRRRLAAGVALAIGLVLSCGGGLRPYLTPFPDAVIDTLDVLPADLIREIATLVTAEGLVISISSPEEGYLETDWYNVGAAASGGTPFTDPRQSTLLRFFADLSGDEQTRLAAEAVVRRTLDPSVPSRQGEMMAPPGHPGYEILHRVLAALDSRFGPQQ